MRKSFVSAIVSVAMLSTAFSVPALGQDGDPPDPDFGPNPRGGIVGMSGETAQEICNRNLPPGVEGFTATVIDESEILVSTSGPVRDAMAFSREGSGTPTFSDFANHRSARVNGQSPNIHALADAGVTTFPDTVVGFHTTITSSFATGFGCEVSRTNPSGRVVTPPGLQSSGNRTAVNRTTSVAGMDEFDTLTGVPFVSNIVTMGVQVVICISPGSNKGSWRPQNEYTGNIIVAPLTSGACSRAFYDAVATNLNPPTNSLPSS